MYPNKIVVMALALCTTWPKPLVENKMSDRAIKCGGCNGNGTCLRCHGMGKARNLQPCEYCQGYKTMQEQLWLIDDTHIVRGDPGSHRGGTEVTPGFSGGSKWIGWPKYCKKKLIAKPGDRCPYCRGEGISSRADMSICNRCNGSGICPGCKGSGWIIPLIP